MTQSDSDDPVQEDDLMPDDEAALKLDRRLSPSARAILRFIQVSETGGKIEVFSEDADTVHLRKIVKSYRGHLYPLLMKRLGQVLRLGGVEIITQRDIMSLIDRLWADNISTLTKTELPFLEAVLKSPGDSLKSLSEKARFSYPQARRAQKRLSESGVLKIGGMLNTDQLGLERILIVLENPSLVLSGPYCQKELFVDGYSPLVLIVAIVPYAKRKDLMDTVRSLRDSTTNASVYSLSTGHPSFSGLYSDPQKGWSLDLLHFRLMLRKGGDPVTLADIPVPSTTENTRFTYGDTQVMDALIESLDDTANDIAKKTGLSLSTVFRKRASLLTNGTVISRARVNIPQLSDRIIVMCSPEVGGNLTPGWQNLPLTYISRISNLEDNSDEKMLLISALPAGSGTSVLSVLNDETSKVDDYSAWAVAAGMGGATKVSSMYDRRQNTWAYDVSRHFDAVTYSVLRKDASPYNIPLDLA